MNFKSLVRSDAEKIFLSEDEFGETHKVNGKSMTVIIDNNELIEREKKYKVLEEGLVQKQVLFYVSSEKIGRMPTVGKIMSFDDRNYRISDVTREDGMYSILLEVPKQ